MRFSTNPEAQTSYACIWRVRAAFFAATERAAGERRLAAARLCADSALCEAARRPSRFSAFVLARLRFAVARWRGAP
jgi:hypothetical protein